MPYRIIYSLHFDLEPGPSGGPRQLIVPLCPDGTAANIDPMPPKERAIDLRDGDYFTFQRNRERIVHIKAYRQNYCENQPQTVDGFVVPTR